MQNDQVKIKYLYTKILLGQRILFMVYILQDLFFRFKNII